MAKTSDEKLAEIKLKMQQLKNQERAIIARRKEQERKKRVSHYIRMGETMEKYFDPLLLSLDQLDKILQNIQDNATLKDALLSPVSFELSQLDK